MCLCPYYRGTVEPLFNGHFGTSKMSLRKEVPFIERVNLHTVACSWDLCGAHYREVVHCRECPLMEVPLYPYVLIIEVALCPYYRGVLIHISSN